MRPERQCLGLLRFAVLRQPLASQALGLRHIGRRHLPREVVTVFQCILVALCRRKVEPHMRLHAGVGLTEAEAFELGRLRNRVAFGEALAA